MHNHISCRLVLGMLFLAVSVATAQPSEYEKILNRSCAEAETLHLFDASGDPQLVPISLLESFLPSASNNGNTSHSIPEWVAESFLETVNRRRTKPDARCASRAHDSVDCDSPVLRIDGVVDRQKVVVLGTIEYLEASWSTNSQMVMTLVYTRIDEVLKDSSGTLSPGMLVTHVRPWGSAEAGNVTLCTYPPRGILGSQAAIAQQIVIAGALDLRNHNHLVTATDFVFRVQGDTVVPPTPERTNCFEPTTFSIDTLRRLLER